MQIIWKIFLGASVQAKINSMFSGRARLLSGTASWSPVCVIVVVIVRLCPEGVGSALRWGPSPYGGRGFSLEGDLACLEGRRGGGGPQPTVGEGLA